MKNITKLLSLLIMLFMCQTLQAQKDTIIVKTKNDTILTIKVDKDKDNVDIEILDDDDDEEYDHDEDWDDDWDDDDDDDKKSRAKIRLGMLDIGISAYQTEETGFNMPSELEYMEQKFINSTHVGWHVVNLKLPLAAKGKPVLFGISTGLVANFSKYSFENDFRLSTEAARFEDAVSFTEESFDKNRLSAVYAAVPVLLEFNSNPAKSSKSFNLSAGYVHNFLLTANHKLKNNDIGKVKVKNNFHLRKNYGMLEGRIGYGPLNFYVQYGLDNMFQDNEGPELRPINFGVNIIPR